jgi:hypothetical protein
LAPFIGGFLTSYLSKGYENYDHVDEKDGVSCRAVSGLIV